MIRILLLLCILAAPAFAEERVDYVNLGAMLLKDGYTQRAKEALEKADIEGENFDFARYYTLKGILLQKLSYPSLSNIFFNASIKQGQNNPSIFVYEAKNYWQLQDYPEVIAALDKAGKAGKENEQLFLLKAEAYKQQGLFDEAWIVLEEGVSIFPDPSIFYRQKFYYLLELGFYQRALVYAEKYLKEKDYSSKDYLAVAYTLRENKQLEAAATLLERAVLKHDDDDKLVELLGQVYVDMEKYTMAALVFDWASIERPRFALKAATLFLKARQPVRSLQLNRRILGQGDKFRQRMGIYIYQDDYESLVSMTPALKRYDLLKDDNITYALGYGYFQNGDYANAKKYLKQISDSQLFSKASIVFQQIEKCQNEPLQCY